MIPEQGDVVAPGCVPQSVAAELSDVKAASAEREVFYESFTRLLREIKPGRELPPPAPDTHLWEAGYLDSFSMLQVIDHLEGLTGRSIRLGPDALSSFFTLQRIYDTYVGVAA